MNGDWFDREVDLLDEAMDRGELTSEEYNAEIRALRRAYQDAREEAVQRAADDERERW